MQFVFAPAKVMPDNVPLLIAIPIPFLLTFGLAFLKLRTLPKEKWQVLHWNENPFGPDRWAARYATYGCFFAAAGLGMTFGLLFQTGQLWGPGVMSSSFGLGFLSAVALAKKRAKRPA